MVTRRMGKKGKRKTLSEGREEYVGQQSFSTGGVRNTVIRGKKKKRS